MDSKARVILIVLCTLLCACGGANPAPPTAGPTSPPAATALPSPLPATTARNIVAGGCADLPAETQAAAVATPDAAAAADDEPASQLQSPAARDDEPSMPIDYDASTNTILVGKGAPMVLPAVSRVLGRPDLLRELAPGDWLLSANLQIGKGAVLHIAGPDVRRLKLRSARDGFVWIKVFGGRLAFIDTCVTSWDLRANSVDEDYDKGRSFVLARDGAHMDIRDSELSYLGYQANESYGVAWRMGGATGEVINSRFGHNFYGLYSYQAADLVIRGNEVHHSVRYGIDPHTRSTHLLIEQNISHHNGKQGIILAEECSDSIIRANTVYSNTLHGIVLYQRSNNNVVEGNTSYSNGLQGINLNNASHNTIRSNLVYGNAEAGIGLGQAAADNQVAGNTVRDNLKDGIYLYSDATDNLLRDNIVSGNVRYGIYVKSEGNRIAGGNQVLDNAVGVYLNVARPPELSRAANQIYNNREQDVRIGDR